MAHQAGPLDKRLVFTPNRGPLTTIFTPPSNCLATTTALDTSYFVGSEPNGDLGGFPSCYPSSTLSVAASDDVFQPAVYSPGVCPFGYTYAFPYTSQIDGIGEEYRSTTYTIPVTKYVCCPSGFSVSDTDLFLGICSQTATSISNVWQLTPGWPSSTPSSYSLTTATDEILLFVNAKPIVVVWASTDGAVLKLLSSQGLTGFTIPTSSGQSISTLPSGFGFSGTYPTGTTASPGATATGTNATPTSTASSGGMSTSSKIGIGVSVPLGVAVIGLLALFFWLRHKNQKKQAPPPPPMEYQLPPEYSHQPPQPYNSNMTQYPYQNNVMYQPQPMPQHMMSPDGSNLAPGGYSVPNPTIEADSSPVAELSTQKAGLISDHEMNATYPPTVTELPLPVSTTQHPAPSSISEMSSERNSALISVSPASQPAIAMESSDRTEAQQQDLLAQLANVRAQRERLQRIQELEHHEAALHKQLGGQS